MVGCVQEESAELSKEGAEMSLGRGCSLGDARGSVGMVGWWVMQGEG